MSDISKIDKNFVIETKIEKPDMRFINIDSNSCFKIHGVFKENGIYRRMPESVARSVNNGVYALHTHTAGGRVRFVTDSPYIAIHAVINNVGKMSHFALTGSAGFDLYADNLYTKTFVPPFDVESSYEGIAEFAENKTRHITINFPLYSGVSELYIGLKEGSSLSEPTAYRNEKPIVYYGSSITQGGCASRPGTSYQAIVSRKFNFDYINLGFSGSARAEDAISDYIAGLDMHAFVYDYDYNSPSVEHLKETHEKMFLNIRASHPDIPIIMMSAPKYYLSCVQEERRNIIEATYLNAVKSGDKNVYFLDGASLMKLCGNEGTVDGAHPTDFGFASMAEALCELIGNNNL